MKALKKDESKNYCFRCGHEVIWDSTEMACNVYDDTYRPTDFAEINFYHCPHCGVSYEVCDPPEDERKDYPAWQQRSAD